MNPQRSRSSLVALALLLAVGCKKEDTEAQSTESKPEATAAPTAVVDSEIASAVAEVSKQAAAARDGSDAQDAPPPNGILGPERANAEAPIGSPAKVTLGQPGSEPRVQLGTVDFPSEATGTLSVAAGLGSGRGLPPVDYTLSIRGGRDEGAPFTTVSAAIKSAVPGESDMGGIPPQLADALKGLQDSSFSFGAGPAIQYRAPEYLLGKKADQSLEVFLQAARDVVGAFVVSYPKEPVGAGGIWMATVRENMGAADVVSYNLYTVKSIDAQGVHVSVKTQRYLAQPQINNQPVVRFQGNGTVELVIDPRQRLPLQADVHQAMQALVQGQGGQPQPAFWEVRGNANFPPTGSAQAEPASVTSP